MFYKCVVVFALNILFLNSQTLTKEQDEAYDSFMENQDRLTKDLFQNYNPDFTTIYTLRSSNSVNLSDSSHPPPLNMNFKCRNIKLVDVVEREEKVSFLFDWIAEWEDRRLRWNPADYGGIEHFYTLQKNVWKPEITVSDAHDIVDFQPESQKIAWINSNGTVGFYLSIIVSVICELDVYRFPRDTHTCSVNIMFHAYFKNEYHITNEPVDLPEPASQLGNGEFQILAINTSTQISPPGDADIQKINVTFRRNPGFYISLIMIPALFINVLSIVAVFVNVENIPEKLTIGLTNIMAMTFILSILADDLPKTKKIPLLAIYVILSLVIIVAAICCVVILKYVRKMKWYVDQKYLQQQKQKIDYLFMAIFQIANILNFMILYF